MVNYFAIGLTHLLLAIAMWRLVARPDLDRDPPGDSAPAPHGDAPFDA